MCSTTPGCSPTCLRHVCASAIRRRNLRISGPSSRPGRSGRNRDRPNRIPEFEWALSYEGVEFYFEPGLIADYAAGPFHVTVRYVDEPIAVAAKFQRIPAAYAELLEHRRNARSTSTATASLTRC